MSEKYDGVRIYFDGKKQFYSRNGNQLPHGNWSNETILIDNITVDGELV